jgi:hypothetical protein
MTGKAFWEFIMECLFMRFTMTISTLWNIAMFIFVAEYAGKFPVFAGVF